MERTITKSVRALRDYYEVVPRFVYVTIYRDDTGSLVYEVLEPPLTEEEKKIVNLIAESLRDKILRERVPPNVIYDQKLSEEYIRGEVSKIMSKLKLNISREQLDKLLYYIVRDAIGFGKLDPLMRDDNIEDINVNGPGRPVYVWHSRYEHLKTNIVFESSEELFNYVVKISQMVGRNISSANPILEGLIGGFARVEIALSDVSPLGHTISIRKFRREPLTVVDLVRLGTLSPEAVAYLWLMIDLRRNIVILGPTGSGKTTLLNALLYLIRPEMRIVTVEDARELNIPHEQWVALVTRPSFSPQVREITQYDLVKLSMRIRPDYVIVGEVRGEEAYVLFQALASGHSGLTTIHAETPESAVLRLLSRPMNVPPIQLSMAHALVTIHRLRARDMVVRRVVAIDELVDVRRRRPVFRTVFRYDIAKDSIERVSESHHLGEAAKIMFMSPEKLREEYLRRTDLIRAMAHHKFRDPSTVFRIIRSYYLRPEDTYLRVSSGVLP